MTRAVASAFTLALLAACAPSVPPAEERTYANPDSGYRYVTPPHWKFLRGEVRSPNATLITIQAPSLDDADEEFLAGLPESMEPQLLAWAQHFYRVVDIPVRRRATLGGTPAMEMTYPVRIRPTDGPGKVTYLVARHASRVIVVRINYPPGVGAADDDGVREFLDSWEFFTPTGGGEEMPPGNFVLTVPKKPGQ
ncbi:MAG: hypothetical protein ACOY3Y_19110 [Acidobacteriota bacterium]